MDSTKDVGNWVLSGCHKDCFVPHPKTGLLAYGFVGEYRHRRLSVPSGEVRLRVGKHFGGGRGFGVRHILEAHSKELARYGCLSIAGVSSFVANILVSGAEILCEGSFNQDGVRLTVVRGRSGIAILSPQKTKDGIEIYSVVTAFPSGKKMSAMRVGLLR